MVWFRRVNSCGLWLPEDKKLICDMEGENFEWGKDIYIFHLWCGWAASTIMYLYVMVGSVQLCTCM